MSVDFSVVAYNRMQSTKNEKLKKYSNLGRELNNVWNMKITVIPIIVVALGMVIKNLEERILKMSWKSEETCYHLERTKNPSVGAKVKN